MEKQILIKARQYRTAYRFFQLIALLVLVLMGTYWYYSSKAGKNKYTARNDDIRLGGYLGVDSTGKLIAVSFTDPNRKKFGILVSSDSGRHYEVTGEWDIMADEDMDIYDPLNALVVASDNNTIIGHSYSLVYIKPANSDSFIRINPSAFMTDFSTIEGSWFSPSKDSVFFFDLRGNICGMNCRNPDSVIVGQLKDVSDISQVKVNSENIIYAVGFNYQNDFKKGLFTEVKRVTTAILPVMKHNFITLEGYTADSASVDDTIAVPAPFPDSAAKK